MIIIIALLLICGINSTVMAQDSSSWENDVQMKFVDLDYENQELWKKENLNKAQIIQKGNNNTALQKMTKGSANKQYTGQNGSWNRSEQEAEGKNNFSSIEQKGINNKALTVQTGNFNKAIINQRGNSNSAEIKQFSNNNFSIIKQIGSFNKAVIIQN